MQEAHDSPLADHSGIFKTYRKLRKRFYWKGLKEDAQNYVNECKVHQQNKSELTYPVGLLQPLPIPEQKWDSISMDFITGLPKYLGKDCIYMVVDILTNFSNFFDVTSSFSAPQVVDIFFSFLMSDFWKELFRLVGTHLNPCKATIPKLMEKQRG